MESFIAFVITTSSGVLVSLITLALAIRQRAIDEARSEMQRRNAILSAIGTELRWNRTAMRGELDVTNAHLLIGAFTSVAFERHGADLATIAPDSIESVYQHYAEVGKARDGIRVFVGLPNRDANERTFSQWIEVCDAARVDVSNTATHALKTLGLHLTD